MVTGPLWEGNTELYLIYKSEVYKRLETIIENTETKNHSDDILRMKQFNVEDINEDVDD